MTLITEVRFAHERGALAETLNTLLDLEATVMHETSTDPDRSVYFFRFENAPADEIQTTLERDQTVATAKRVAGDEDGQVWSIEFAPETKLLAPNVTNEGGFVVDARSSSRRDQPRGWHEHWVLPDREAVHSIWQHARTDGFEFELLSLNQQPEHEAGSLRSDVLTDKQREALIVAYERGYFTEPRETSLEEIATVLEITPAAVAGRLRRGTKRLIEMSFIVEDVQRTNRRDG